MYFIEFKAPASTEWKRFPWYSSEKDYVLTLLGVYKRRSPGSRFRVIVLERKTTDTVVDIISDVDPR